jgi:hypothetical protein
MRYGSCKQLVAFFQGLTLVHMNLAPLVLTFASREPPSSPGATGGGRSSNVGMVLDSLPLLEEALKGIRTAIELQEQQHGSSDGTSRG